MWSYLFGHESCSHRGVVDPLSLHKYFSLSFSLLSHFPPLFICQFESCHFFCVCVCALSSSSSFFFFFSWPMGPCPSLRRMQWFQIAQTRSKAQTERKEALRKTEKKKLDEDKREMTIEGENRHMIYREGKWEIDRANCELHQHYANRISVERWCDGDVIWGNLTLPVYFLLQDKRGTTHTHPQTRTFLFTFHSLSHTLYLQLHLHDRFCIECTP